MFPCEDSKTVSVCLSVCLSVRLSVRLSVCLSVCPSVCLSVRLSVHLSVPREKKSPYVRQYQSYIINWYINGKAFTSSTPWKQKKLNFFQKSSKFEFWLVLKSWNNLSFVNISPTLVIDASLERSSRVIQHGNPKIWFFFQKSSKFEFWLLTKSWNNLSFVNISPTLVIDTSMERSSRVLQHGNPKLIFFFFSKKFEIRILTKSWNLLSFVNISPTLVFDTSMERSSRVLEHGNIIIWFKKNRNWILTCFFFNSKLNFYLCQRDEIIQVGLNMHLYVDIGDASSSLWGSTSSFT